MTGQGAERTHRVSYPDPCVPVGGSTLMPPPSQEAERRPERRARRTRWGLRVLVVGGLAGVAWLLTGAAAQAADRADGPAGSSLGSVVGDDTTVPDTGLLTAADQPLETTAPAQEQHNAVADVLDVPRRMLNRPVDATVEDDPVDPAVDPALWESAGTTRLTGGPADVQELLTTATDAVDGTPAERSSDDLTDVEQSSVPAEIPERTDLERTDRDAEPAVVPDTRPVVSRTVISTHVVSEPATGKSVHTSVAAHRVVASGRHGGARTAHRHRAASPADHVPAARHDDEPAAPLQLRLGDVSGVPAGGSGTPIGGGAPAFLPAAIVDSRMARHPLPVADDVVAWHYEAEAPTVSPD